MEEKPLLKKQEVEIMDEWKTIEPGVWKPEKENQQITGILVSKEPKNEKTGLSARYYLDTRDGMFFVWGTAVLDDRMQYAKIGDKVRITYGGKTTNKLNQMVNLFKVEVAGGAEPGSEEGASESRGRFNTE
ncbi:conserved hypothetical protein [delta proteobacterium NaphS2]|nr:conserved hypothetical protein [delta proteobacterium NaphS2]